MLTQTVLNTKYDPRMAQIIAQLCLQANVILEGQIKLSNLG